MMLGRLSIQQRILITFIVIVSSGSLLQFMVAGRKLQITTLEFYQHHLETDALLVATTLSEPLEKYMEGEDENQMRRTLAALQQEIGHNYLMIDGSYRIVSYTPGMGYESLDRVPKTPELSQAEHGQIGADVRVDHAGVSSLYVAVPIQYEQSPIGFLILSEPIQPAYDEVNRHWMELGGTALVVMGLVVTASLWISSSISRPVQYLRNSALKMAGGDLNTRIKIKSQDEVGQLAQAFNYMAGQLDTLLKTQRSFVSYAAHELRTPLMTLKLRAEMLDDERLPTKERDTYICEIRQEVDHMAELVSSLLILARIDEGRHTRSGKIMDTVSALHDIARHWRIEATQAGLGFEMDIQPDLPDLPLSANDLRLVLDNLLGNAVKYTPEGKIAFSAASQNSHVTIQIQDTGIGFTPDQASRLFERFYRGETIHTYLPGHGLGLSIVQAVLAQYGGRIEAHSAGTNQGAAFTVTLPVNFTPV